MDGTQDILRREQVSLFLRYVDSKLQSAEIFFWFYHAKKTDAATRYSEKFYPSVTHEVKDMTVLLV